MKYTEMKHITLVNEHYNGNVVSTLEFSFREVQGEYKVYRKETYHNKLSDTRNKPKYTFFRKFDPNDMDKFIDDSLHLFKMVGYKVQD